MRIVVQRVKSASVVVDGDRISTIDAGLLVLVGVSAEDTVADAQHLAGKVARLRIFEDHDGKMNLSLQDVGGEVLSVSQFTLYGDCRKGNRPSFIGAAAPELGRELFDRFVSELAKLGFSANTGRFGADMQVELLNDGPVTLILESTGRE